MKKLLIIAFIGLGQLVAAQVSRNLGDFTTVRAFDRINVTLMKSTQNKIEIRGEKANDVEVVNKNGDLKIRMKLTKLLSGDNVEATVYYTGNIQGVEASEGATVTSSDTFKAVAFDISAKEGAKLVLKLDADRVKTKANSGGIVELKGSAKNHDVTMTSGAELQAVDFDTAQTIITLNAGGSANVRATDFVDAKTRAGGDINIYGNPKQVNQKTIAGGSINIK